MDKLQFFFAGSPTTGLNSTEDRGNARKGRNIALGNTPDDKNDIRTREADRHSNNAAADFRSGHRQQPPPPKRRQGDPRSGQRCVRHGLMPAPSPVPQRTSPPLSTTIRILRSSGPPPCHSLFAGTIIRRTVAGGLSIFRIRFAKTRIAQSVALPTLPKSCAAPHATWRTGFRRNVGDSDSRSD